jgi:hypothetical protein
MSWIGGEGPRGKCGVVVDLHSDEGRVYAGSAYEKTGKNFGIDKRYHYFTIPKGVKCEIWGKSTVIFVIHT